MFICIDGLACPIGHAHSRYICKSHPENDAAPRRQRCTMSKMYCVTAGSMQTQQCQRGVLHIHSMCKPFMAVFPGSPGVLIQHSARRAAAARNRQPVAGHATSRRRMHMVPLAFLGSFDAWCRNGLSEISLTMFSFVSSWLWSDMNMLMTSAELVQLGRFIS